MAQAILSGINPYLPLPELANCWMSYANYSQLRHPTPHPPVVGFLGLPFTFLSYEQASLAWLCFELVCLLLSLVLLFRWWEKPIKARWLALSFILALGWIPIIEDLWYGQLTSSLLLLLLGAWLALRVEKDALGGALLGGLIALKLTAWPIIIFLALRRRWRGVGAALGVAIAANLLAMAGLGFTVVKDYYLKVGPAVAAFYRLHDTNYSTWTIGSRLFADFGYNVSISSLWSSVLLTELCTYLLPIVVLLGGLWIATKAQEFDTAFGLLVGVGILVSPIAWTHYMMLAVVPIMVVARRLWARGCPKQPTYLAFCLCLLLSIPGLAYTRVVIWFTNQPTSRGIPIAPFAAGFLTLAPTAALSILLWSLWRTDQGEFQNSNQRTLGIAFNRRVSNTYET